MAVVLRPDAIRARRTERAFAAAAALHARLEAGRHADLSTMVGLSNEPAEELVAYVRAERDGGPG